MKPIFISYKRANADIVYKIVGAIEEAVGVKCWIDIDGIESNRQFISKICRAIEECEIVLFMYSSAHANIDYEKDYTIKELNYAQAKNKEVILVKIDDTPLDNIFLFEYGPKNHRDYRDKYQFDALISDIKHLLGTKQPTNPHEDDNTPFTLEMGMGYAELYRQVYQNPDMSIADLRRICGTLSLSAQKQIEKYGTGTWSNGKYSLRLIQYPLDKKTFCVKTAYNIISNPSVPITKIKRDFDNIPSVLVSNLSRLHAECMQSLLFDEGIRTAIEIG